MFKNILLIIITLLFFTANANADITGVISLFGGTNHTPNQCAAGLNENENGTAETYPAANNCTITDGYVPKSGNYAFKTYTYINSQRSTTFTTDAAYVDASKSIESQKVKLTGGRSSLTAPAKSRIVTCAYAVGPDGSQYSVPGVSMPSPCPYYPSLPSTPTVPDTSCSINGGSALSVSLGTMNRDEIPTAPDSASAITKTIPVTCTGGKVTVKMKLNYTSISIGSSQAVKTSANGVGAAIFYGSKALSPSDVSTIAFSQGSNSLTLGFQAVRNSTVALKDIPTGAFTANAVLVMTQQ